MKPDLRPIADSIRALAARALADLPPGCPARLLAELRGRRPVDYMRCAEFPAVADRLDLRDGMRVLDIASPQWFSIHLAAAYPGVEFHYANIIEAELDRYRPIPQALKLTNLTYHRQDVRKLSFAAGAFDRVISISVIEHVAPVTGGDRKALEEVRGVLAGKGRLLLTVPLKDRAAIVRSEGPVYEREGKDKKFFAREYDGESFFRLVEGCGFTADAVDYICERKGLLSPDYYEWGPGRNVPLVSRLLAGLRGLSEGILHFPFDEALASRYLEILPEPACRVVNVAACLRKR